MKASDVNYIQDCVEQEGFDYAFVHYTDFANVENQEFHKLRRAFLEARENLVNYCGIED